MEKYKFYEDLSLILSRTNKVLTVVSLLILVLIFSCWKGQILDYKKYWNLAEANRTRESVIIAPRGLITDRNDIILAENSASFKASIIRENCRDYDRSLDEVGRLLEIVPEDLKTRIVRFESLPLFRPIVGKDNLDLKDVSRLARRPPHAP